MKRRISALTLCICLLLSGCKAMLERSYSVATPHVDRPTTAEDPSVLRVESYQELVSAVLYLVSQHAEEGVIQLHNYDGDEESDLSNACLEVATQDPLGAYAVDYIKHELSRVVSYYQATLAIRYRRTAEQVEGIASVTGAGAIRDRLKEALGEFAPEVTLRIPYFFGDEDDLQELLREAYYAAPETALGLPKAEIDLYPESGRERIVEVLLEYPEEPEALKEKQAGLEERVEELFPGNESPARAPEEALAALWGAQGENTAYDPEGGSTAYAAIVEGRADSEGMALGFALLCARMDIPCQVAEGTYNGEGRWWNVLHGETPADAVYIDPSFYPERGAELYSAEKFSEMGYLSRQT